MGGSYSPCPPDHSYNTQRQAPAPRVIVHYPMLRSSLRSARVLNGKPGVAAAGRQWSFAATRQASLLSKRGYADQKKSADASVQPIIPPTETKSSERAPNTTLGGAGESKAAPASNEIPLTPPNPTTSKDKRPTPPASIDDVGESRAMNDSMPPTTPIKSKKPEPTATIDDVGESYVQQSQVPPPPPSPPKKKGLFRRLRNFVFTLMVLGAVGFGGGVWYSRVNDTFHDFFIEYVPFGEQAVLYLEEADFKKRFPHSQPSRPRETGEHVRIPAQSGASWRVADTAEPSARQSSASPSSQKSAPNPAAEAAAKTEQPGATNAKRAENAVPTIDQKSKTDQSDVAPPASKSTSEANPAGFKAPEVNEPSKMPPLEPIDLLKLADAREPVVQDLVHMLNDLILVINADGAHGKYGSTIEKAKNDVQKIGGKLRQMKAKVEQDSAKEVRDKVSEFDKAATELVSRVEKAMISQEMEWRNEFEQEMKGVRQSYEDRVQLLLERERKVNEEKLQNQLLQQAVALKKEFVDEVKDRVEKERDGRLGKLTELSQAVSDLEKLSLGWNDVVDTNLKTQQLHVAVEAVRAKLDNASHPSPFIKELVALKEIANDNPAVNAAIASVNPASYQRGVFTTSQLIDRFRRVASEVRKASLLPSDAGVASHASSWVLSHVMFKKEGLAEGNDVESILTRTQTFLEEGDLDSAAREMNGLDGWAKTLSKDWMGEVRKVLEVQQALEVIATEARLQSLRVE